LNIEFPTKNEKRVIYVSFVQHNILYGGNKKREVCYMCKKIMQILSQQRHEENSNIKSQFEKLIPLVVFALLFFIK